MCTYVASCVSVNTRVSVSTATYDVACVSISTAVLEL